MSDDLPIRGALRLPGRDLSWTAVRSSGPGGQNVNKVATKVQLRFDLAGSAALRPEVKRRLRALAGRRVDREGQLLVVCDETRSQAENLDRARAQLAALVRQALTRPKPRKATKPSRSAKRRRLDEKRKQSEKKQARGRVSKDTD